MALVPDEHGGLVHSDIRHCNIEGVGGHFHCSTLCICPLDVVVAALLGPPASLTGGFFGAGQQEMLSLVFFNRLGEADCLLGGVGIHFDVVAYYIELGLTVACSVHAGINCPEHPVGADGEGVESHLKLALLGLVVCGIARVNSPLAIIMEFRNVEILGVKCNLVVASINSGTIRAVGDYRIGGIEPLDSNVVRILTAVALNNPRKLV